MSRNHILSLLFIVCIMLLVISCSSSNDLQDSIDDDTTGILSDDSEDGQNQSDQNNNDDENQKKVISFSIQVNGEYFDETLNGIIILSNAQGEVLVEKTLQNNLDNRIEVEVDINSKIDASLFTKEIAHFNTIFEIHTFRDISSEDYFIEKYSGNGNGDTFYLTLTNTGADLETVSNFSDNVIGNLSNGENYRMNIELDNYPGTFYAAFLSPNEGSPRYYHNTEIERSSVLERDYSDLPIIENKIDVEFPFLNIYGASIYGFETVNGIRKKVHLDETASRIDSLYFPSGIFDNFELTSFISCCNDTFISYMFKAYGTPNDMFYHIPVFSASFLDSRIDNFSVESISDHDYSTVLYLQPTANIYDDEFRLYVHSEGSESVSFSKQTLLTNIIQLAQVQSNNNYEIRFGSIDFIDNSHLSNNYAQYIQSVIGNQIEFPAGTTILSRKHFSNHFEQ